MVEALNAAGVKTGGDLYLASNTCEEGLGDLKGMKAFMADVKDKVAAAIAVEGMKVNRIVHVAVGSRRYKVIYTARGGHSWGHFGSPSAIHILGRAIADISRLEVPTDPKTTYNVGVIHGGTTVNTIAAEADMLVDMRSIDARSLADSGEAGAGHRGAGGQGGRRAGRSWSWWATGPPARSRRIIPSCKRAWPSTGPSGSRPIPSRAARTTTCRWRWGCPACASPSPRGPTSTGWTSTSRPGPIPTGVKNILLAAVALTHA